MLCSDRRGKGERFITSIDGDHLGRGGRPNDLHRHVPQSTDSDDCDSGIRCHFRPRPSYCVIRRETRIGQRCGSHRIEIGGQLDKKSFMRHQHVVGHATISTETTASTGHHCVLRILTVRFDSQTTARACPTTPRSIDDNGIAFLHAGDTASHRVNPSGIFMTKRERRVEGQRPGFELIHQVKIRVAHARATNLDHHFPITRSGCGHLHQLWVALPGHQLQCAHVAPPRPTVRETAVWTTGSTSLFGLN